MRTPTIILRENTWHIRKRVPVRYAAVEPRSIVHISLHTDSRALAQSKAADVWREMLEAWEAKLVGQDKAAEDRMAAARNLAQRRGYRYLSAPDVAQLPITDLLTRLESTVDGAGRFDPREADAALGLASPPVLTVEQALDAFYEVAAEDLRGKNDDQIRRWKNPRIKATRNFIEVVGNKALAEVTTDDIYAFRKWWVDRVMEGETRADTANKDFTHLIGSWKRVCRAKGIQLGFSSEGLMLRTDTDKDDVRPPFGRDWIKDKLLAPGALDGLNVDARLILLGMVNTGYRPSEGAGLMADDIRLADPVPHILIRRNENRALKTAHSKRAIPLLGVSLDAFRQAPHPARIPRRSHCRMEPPHPHRLRPYRRDGMSDTRTHPDDLARLLADLADQHGYGLVSVDLIGRMLVGGVLPEYRYRSEVITATRMDGRMEAITSPMTQQD